jgi:hypothetical protein
LHGPNAVNARDREKQHPENATKVRDVYVMSSFCLVYAPTRAIFRFEFLTTMSLRNLADASVTDEDINRLLIA